ncbi:hypothetical protein OG730_41790 (plasmid) [Streptomyces sp. NBC_01298]|uniref:hypothetical protein n=1 Tax=Streptomyces sp. NBC_01298 TaxID=2903817 RepID=UPI002E16763E|nr:hypothetical protein OG730_41790 [Streptomyces sp. NBC_01298]
MQVVPVARERAERDGAGQPGQSPLGALLPGGRIRPGTAVSAGADMPLLLALAAEASAGTAGWAAVGLPGLGPRAAADAGLDLGAGLWIDTPGRSWPQVLATVLEAVPVVMVGHLPPAPDRVLRRLSAVMRRSGAVLLAAAAWDGADVRLQVTSATWDGVGEGFGLLRGRRATVLSTGRGAAARARHADLWLPGPDGRVAPVSSDTDTATGGMPDNTAVSRPVLRVLG